MRSDYNRREILKLGALAGAGLMAGRLTNLTHAKTMFSAKIIEKTKPMDVVKIGLVGVGRMGSNHVKNLLKVNGAEIKAVCDIVPEKIARVQKWVQNAGFAKPNDYSKGERDFERMCETEELDLVITATPWQWHVPVCIAAMKNGKHATTEVPAAVTIEQCWQLVETAEKYQKHCVMLENCCYDQVELMILNMTHKGLLGEILHGECGYMHDLRDRKLGSDGIALWRTEHSIKRNGNLYPTHGLGPIAQCMDVNRGDRFDYLVSMSSNARGLNEYAREHFGSDHPMAKQKFALGDVNSSLIRTVNGKTILIQHDCNLPRPYSRKILLQGTKGIVRKYPERKIYIEGRTPLEGAKAHPKWESLDNYKVEYEHPLWKKGGEKLESAAGHGGMDYLEVYRLIEAIKKGVATDMDVYDAAAWSAIAQVSEKSVANKSRPVKISDFTRGMWKKKRPLPVMNF